MRLLNNRNNYVFGGICLILLALVSAMFLTTNGLQASSFIQIDREKQPPTSSEKAGEFWDYILVPLLIAPDEYYSESELNTQFSNSIGFPIARMNAKREANLDRISVYSVDSSGFENVDDIGFRILSSIRYEFEDGSIVYVSTTLPSPAAIDSVLSFAGNVTLLGTQGEVWLDTNVNLDETPNNINFIKDNLIITVTGNVAVEELLSIADELVFE